MHGVRRFGRLVPMAALILLAASAEVGAMPGDARSLGKDLQKAISANNAQQIQGVLEQLIELGGADANAQVVELIPKVQRVGDEIYWQLVSGAAGFRDARALTSLGEFIVKSKSQPFARDLLFALENNPSPLTVNALQRVLSEKTAYDMQLMAADQLARVRTVESVDALMAQLKAEGDKGDRELKRRIMSALQAITGENMGDPINWTGWWEANRKNGLPEKAAGEGDNHAGAQLASQVLDPNRKKEFESLTRSPKRIVVISSRLPADDPKQPNHDYNYDHMEAMLQQMEIAHTVVLKKDFEKEPEKYLRDAWTILVNCNNIQTQCICTECNRILQENLKKGTAGGTTNRLYTCPPDCPKGHDQVTYRMTQQTIDKIKAWVDAGGYLFTEDWGIVEVLQPGWPNIVENGKTNPVPGGGGEKTEYNLVRAMDVTIVPGRGVASLPLLRGVFARPRAAAEDKDKPEGDGGTRVRDLGEGNPAAPPQHQWKIDDESPAIQVKAKGEVTVLMESEDLGKVNGGHESVAITFRSGNGDPRQQGQSEDGPRRPVTGGGGGGGGDAGGSRPRGRGEWAETVRGGRVLHVISHFGKQQSRREDTFVLQNLILNFIMESNRQHTP